MPRLIEFEGRTIEVPEDATDKEVAGILKAASPAQQQSQVSSKLSELAMNPAKSMAKGGLGWLEGGAQMLTGLGGAAIGGLSGLGTLMTGGGVEKAAKNASYLSSALTYQPRSEEGQGVSQALAAPIELASKGTGYVGEKVGGMLGNESAGRTIGEVSPAIAAILYGGSKALDAAKNAPPPKAPEIPGVGSISRGLRDVVRTRSKAGQQKLAEEYLQKLATPDEAPKIVSALERRGQAIVPGSPVTSADAIARANRELALKGKPERFGGAYAALEEGLAKVPETSGQLRTIQLQQEAARANVLNKGVGTDAARTAAESTRQINAAKNYGELAKSKAIVEMGKTSRLIDGIVKAKPANKTLVNAMDDVKSSLYETNAQGVSQLRTNPGQLQSAIENINNLISKQENVPVRRQLMVVKKSIETQINKVEKLQGTATKQYAIDSVPLAQMDLWSALRDKFVSPTGKEAPGSYLRALRDETKLIKQATGFKRGHSVSDIFNKDQSSLAARLAAEMEMELVKKRMAGEVNLQGVGRAAEGLEPQLPNMLMRETMVANFLLRNLAKNANVDVNIAAARILADPKQLAGVLKQVKVENRPGVMKYIKDAAINKNTAVMGLATEEQ